VFTERRGARFTDATLGGIPIGTEYRSTYRALPPGPTGPGTAVDMYRRLEQLEAEIRESEKKLAKLWG
jgi:hypothetical protein